MVHGTSLTSMYLQARWCSELGSSSSRRKRILSLRVRELLRGQKKRLRLKPVSKQVTLLVLKPSLQGWQKKVMQMPFATTCSSASVPSLVSPRRQMNGCTKCCRQGFALMLQASIQILMHVQGLGTSKAQSSGSQRWRVQVLAPTQCRTMLLSTPAQRQATFHGHNGGCNDSVKK